GVGRRRPLGGWQGAIDPSLPPSSHISSDVSSENTTFCFCRPSVSRYVRKNGASVQLLRTLGMPMRTVRRAFHASADDRWKLRWIWVFLAPRFRNAFSTFMSV